MYRYRFTGLALLLLVTGTVLSFNRSLFFRTSNFWGEPRFVRPWLSTLDIQALGGSNHRGRNGQGTRTNLLSIYGSENVQALSDASPGMPLVLPGNPENICFRAVGDVFEMDFNFYQNFTCGFFAHFHFPMIIVRTCPSGYIEDCACAKRPCKHYDPAWENPVDLLEPFLDQFNICLNRTDKAAASDSTLFLGWSYTYDNTCYLDYVDTSLKLGVLFPTGRKRNPDQLFSIAYGYNGHWGVPLSWDISFGVFDWLTFGYHADTVFFINKKRCLRMKTQNEAPCGLIVLGKGVADVKQGTVWRMGTYLKADHFYNGLSFLLGFSYEQRNDDKIRPCDPEQFPSILVNKDPHFKKWARSIVHLQAEYDFAHEESCVGTRFGLFYSHELTGLRTFNINTGGGYLGIDIAWTY